MFALVRRIFFFVHSCMWNERNRLIVNDRNSFLVFDRQSSRVSSFSIIRRIRRLEQTKTSKWVFDRPWDVYNRSINNTTTNSNNEWIVSGLFIVVRIFRKSEFLSSSKLKIHLKCPLILSSLSHGTRLVFVVKHVLYHCMLTMLEWEMMKIILSSAHGNAQWSDWD